MPVVVFDFDKTLTKQDTVMGFLESASGKRLVPLRKMIMLCWAVLHKLKLISNDRLKQAGVQLFLQGMTREAISNKAKSYAESIELNDFYQTEYLLKYPDAIIATASFEDYVQPLFEKNLILGARLAYEKEVVSGLSGNAYGKQKVSLLEQHGITKVDVFYTDSFSDRALMDISEVVYLVKNNSIKKIKG